jgi:DNA repair protein RadC
MKTIQKYKLELVRESEHEYLPSSRISEPEDVFRTLESVFELSKQPEELFVILAMTTAGTIAGAFEISHGDLNTAIVNPREVFKRAMLVNANSIILAHNHPSGELKPSLNDKTLTSRLVECGKILGITVMDHLIVGGGCYHSMKEEGDM